MKTTTTTTAKVHPVQRLMAREVIDLADMAAVAVVAVTALEFEEDAALTVVQVAMVLAEIVVRPMVGLVTALMATMALHTKDTSEALVATAALTITADQDDVGLGAVVDHSQGPDLSLVPSADRISSASASAKLHQCLHRCGRRSRLNIAPITATTLLRKIMKTSHPKLISLIHRLLT